MKTSWIKIGIILSVFHNRAGDKTRQSAENWGRPPRDVVRDEELRVVESREERGSRPVQTGHLFDKLRNDSKSLRDWDFNQIRDLEPWWGRPSGDRGTVQSNTSDYLWLYIFITICQVVVDRTLTIIIFAWIKINQIIKAIENVTFFVLIHLQ